MNCAIYTKQADLSFEKCDRFAFTPLSDDHLKQVTRKNYPFFVDNEAESHYICLAHHKLIQNGPKFNEQTHRINLAQYEMDDRRILQEFLTEFGEYNLLADEHKNALLNSLFNQSYENLYQRYRNYENLYEDGGDGKDLKSNNPPRENFGSLSATTLRRYKKFFKLPNRSGATSKIQLLDGVHEHFESIQIDIKEVAANFLSTIKRNANQLDNPIGGGGGGWGGGGGADE